MSNMKKTLGLLASQMALYAASGEDLVYGVPSHIVRAQKKPSKGESKKCKTCTHFIKGKDFCSCSFHKVYIAPMKTACESYERRNKK